MLSHFLWLVVDGLRDDDMNGLKLNVVPGS